MTQVLGGGGRERPVKQWVAGGGGQHGWGGGPQGVGQHGAATGKNAPGEGGTAGEGPACSWVARHPGHTSIYIYINTWWITLPIF